MKIALKQNKLSRHIKTLRKHQELHRKEDGLADIDSKTLEHREEINRAFNISTFKELENYKFIYYTRDGMLVYVKDKKRMLEVRI